MNGPIVQLIALVLYANAYMQGEDIPDFFENSTAQFDRKIQFSAYKKMFTEDVKVIEYSNPNIFFKKICQEVNKFNIYYEPVGIINGIKERYTAGFVGGGGKWRLIANFKSHILAWENIHKLNGNKHSKKIWDVEYLKDKNFTPKDNEPNPNYLDSFHDSLEAIYDFALRNGENEHAKGFENAILTLDTNGKKKFGYHKDLVPRCFMQIEYILDACQSAWCFGGMGSWNDMYIKNDEYENTSQNLYDSLIQTIIECVNGATSLML